MLAYSYKTSTSRIAYQVHNLFVLHDLGVRRVTNIQWLAFQERMTNEGTNKIMAQREGSEQ